MKMVRYAGMADEEMECRLWFFHMRTDYNIGADKLYDISDVRQLYGRCIIILILGVRNAGQ